MRHGAARVAPKKPLEASRDLVGEHGAQGLPVGRSIAVHPLGVGGDLALQVLGEERHRNCQSRGRHRRKLPKAPKLVMHRVGRNRASGLGEAAHGQVSVSDLEGLPRWSAFRRMGLHHDHGRHG